MPADLYESYQNWINSLNPATAPDVRTDPALYAQPSEFDAPIREPFSFPGAGESAYAREEWDRLAREERLKLEEDAQRARGQNEFQQLVSGGATPEEAYRKTAVYLHWNHPERLAQGLNIIGDPAKPFMPQRIQEGGNTLWQLGPNRWQLEKPEMPQNVKDDRKILDGQIKQLQSGMMGLGPTPADVPKLEQLQSKFKELGTNWTGQSTAPTKDATQPLLPSVTTQAQFDKLPKGSEYIGKNGRRFRKP